MANIVFAVLSSFLPIANRVTSAEKSNDEIIRAAVEQLILMQEDDGAWPYEGVYRVRGEIPIGYRVGGTALAGQALLHGAPEDERTNRALQRGVALILKELQDKRMASSRDFRYDVRIWGQAFALEFFCQILKANRAGVWHEEAAAWVPKLTAILLEEELDGGGWNYANRLQHASFVTAPVVQALLAARAAGANVPDDVLTRSARVLQASRVPGGGFKYSGVHSGNASKDEWAKTPGSIGRSPLCETTLLLLGKGDINAIQQSLDAFHDHWGELEKRRGRSGTHEPPFGIAPYYFYFAHRYAAQAIGMLPETARARERDRLEEKLLGTREPDGTWNDRVFPRSRNYGTSMAIIILLGDRFPLPPAIAK